jgi:hypothetical protein
MEEVGQRLMLYGLAFRRDQWGRELIGVRYPREQQSISASQIRSASAR